jgi:hypothetical protein
VNPRAVEQQRAPSTTERSDTGQLIPLSQCQLGLWVLQQGMPASTSYNVPVCLRLAGSVDPALFRYACRLLIASHPLLGAGVIMRNHAPHLHVGSRIYAKYHHEHGVCTDPLAYLRRKAKLPFALNDRSH